MYFDLKAMKIRKDTHKYWLLDYIFLKMGIQNDLKVDNYQQIDLEYILKGKLYIYLENDQIEFLKDINSE